VLPRPELHSPEARSQLELELEQVLPVVLPLRFPHTEGSPTRVVRSKHLSPAAGPQPCPVAE